jgi:protein-S-isoprenylcysteine O-methyltransferase Ste14
VTAPAEDRRRELDRLQAQVATRASTLHQAHAAIATFLSLLAFSFAAMTTWGKYATESTEELAPVGIACGAVLLLYTLFRVVLGLRANKREREIIAQLVSLRRELQVEDPSALLPR